MSDYKSRYTEDELRRVEKQIQERMGEELEKHRSAQPEAKRTRPLKRTLPSERHRSREQQQARQRRKQQDSSKKDHQQTGQLSVQEVHGSRGFFACLHMAVWLYTRGVLYPGSKQFNRKLEDRLVTRYFAALEGLHDTIDQVAGPDSEYAGRIMARLSQDNILYADLVYELLALSDYQAMDTITATLHDYPEEPVYGLKRPFLQLYRDLLFVRPNRTALENTLSRLFLHYGLVSGDEERSAVQHRAALRA